MTFPIHNNAAADATSEPLNFDFRGKILRKKNISAEYLKLAIQEDGREKSTAVYIPRKEAVCIPSDFNYLYLGSTIHVRGHVTPDNYHHVTQCNLVRCAPNIKLIKEILALPNYFSFAYTLNMKNEEQQLKEMVEENSKKIVVNTIVERITGKQAKAPPRYRPGRVKKSDMEILEYKEAEGRDYDSSHSSWKLCQPCQPSENDTIASTFDRRKEIVTNLPDGAEDLVSAHGKLTRTEYLETKKNNQASWFIERIQQFEKKPTRFLDVGGGRGDLAVQIALNFPDARVIVVDSNESSVIAGREYSAKCHGVMGRIEFVCMDFTEYVGKYNDAAAAGDDFNGGGVDFVVALHACGDLSDMALSFASSNQCNFVICPCCYPKRYLAPFVPHWHGMCKTKQEIDSLSRLVELDDHREVSRRAMLVINSMRRSAFENRQVVGLEEFDNKISKRNIALVGDAIR